MLVVFLLLLLLPQTHETAVCHLAQMPCLLLRNPAIVAVAVVVVVGVVILVVMMSMSNSVRAYSCVKEVHPHYPPPHAAAAAAAGVVSPRLPSKRDGHFRNHQWHLYSRPHREIDNGLNWDSIGSDPIPLI